MVCLCIENDIWVRVEAPNISDLPHLGPVQVWLRNREKHQQGDSASELKWHQPKHGRSLPPFASKGLVVPVPLRIPVLDSLLHLGDL